MKETPAIIYLTPDDEDPDYIIWQNHQPADHDNGVAYVRKDVAEEWLCTAQQGIEKNTLKLTRLLDEHPHGWDGPCECAECRSLFGSDG